MKNLNSSEVSEIPRLNFSSTAECPTVEKEPIPCVSAPQGRVGGNLGTNLFLSEISEGEKIAEKFQDSFISGLPYSSPNSIIFCL